MKEKLTNEEKVLAYLQKVNQKVSRDELVEKTGVSSSNFSKLLKKLEEKKKIIKEYKQEGRSKFLFISLSTNCDTNSISQDTISDKKTKPNKPNVSKTHSQENKVNEVSTNSHTISHNYNRTLNKSSFSPLRTKELNDYINEMRIEFQSFGTILPLIEKQRIVNWVLENVQNLYDGIYNYLRIWKKRYEKYLVRIPDSPVIGKVHEMQKALDYIKELKKLKKKLKKK